MEFVSQLVSWCLAIIKLDQYRLSSIKWIAVFVSVSRVLSNPVTNMVILTS